MRHLTAEKGAPSAMSGNELTGFMEYSRWENYLDAFDLCWFFLPLTLLISESCFAHILCYWCQSTLSIFTCQKRRKTLFQCPKDLAPVKDIHLTLTVGLWQLEDIALKSRAGSGWGGEERTGFLGKSHAFHIQTARSKKRLCTRQWRRRFQPLFTRSILLHEKGVG